MASKPMIDIESLHLSFRETQNAKSCLEKDLAEKRQQRRQQEAALEAVNVKYAQGRDIEAKMQETRRVALYKLDKTQDLCNSLESSNENKRDMLTRLGDELKKVDKHRECKIEDFEEGLSYVSQAMRNAKALYSAEQIEKAFQESVAAEVTLEKLGDDYEKEFTDTESQLQELQKQLDQDENRAYSRVAAEQLLAIFEKAEKDADAYLQQMDQILGQRLVPDESVPPAQQQQYMDNQRISCA